MNKEVIITLFLTCCSLNLLTACSDTSYQNKQSNQHTTLESVVGIIEDVDSQIILMNEENDYKVSGVDLSEKVGKKLKLTGIITENEGQFTLNVSEYAEIAFDDS